MKSIEVRPGLIAAALLIAFSAKSRVDAQDWIASDAPVSNWRAVACSADARKMIAAADRIYISTNYGSNWVATSAPNLGWVSVASSAEGDRLLAAVHDGSIYLSTNWGASWTATAVLTAAWASVAWSADGMRLVAVETNSTSFYGLIHVSTDSGTTWSATSAPNFPWRSVASSANGTMLAALGHDFRVVKGEIFTSTNSGSSWDSVASMSSDAWPGLYAPLSIASSADGKTLVAATLGGVGASTNSGATWTVGSLSTASQSAASSADGCRLSVATSDGYTGTILTSTSSGLTWAQSGAPQTNWACVASSADGYTLVACGGGGIYVRRTQPNTTLSAKLRGADLLVSWLVPSVNFVLQQNPDIATANWSDVTVAPALNYTNLHYEASVPPGPGAMFYRLASRLAAP